MPGAAAEKSLPHAVIGAIERGLLRPGTAQAHGDRRSVVACILRRRGVGVGAVPSVTTRHDRPQNRLGRGAYTAKSTAGRALDVLFILRSEARSGPSGAAARWSGQVAFPGGHVEPGETDTDAVVREVREEVGIDLRRPRAFRQLGEIPPRVVTRTRAGVSSTLVVGCHVYLAERPVGPLRLDPAEVAAAGWTPLDALLTDAHVAPLGWSELGIAIHGDVDARAFDHMPSVHLPMLRPVVVAAGVAATPGLVARRFRLWGLTLRLVNDWLTLCGLRKYPIGLTPPARL